MKKLLLLAIFAALVFESQQQVEEGSGDAPSLSMLFSSDDDPDEDSDLSSCTYAKEPKCWTEWFDIDDPCGGGDRERRKKILEKYPGKMCPDPVDIEVETVSGMPLDKTGDVIHKMNRKAGFVCKNSEQPNGKRCSDYKVRFSCYPPFCASGVCWTPWLNRDKPTGTGDWEILPKLRLEKPGTICAWPTLVEAVTVDTLTPASATGEEFYIYNPNQGFVCRKEDQPDYKCLDYKVRFGCHCKFKTITW